MKNKTGKTRAVFKSREVAFATAVIIMTAVLLSVFSIIRSSDNGIGESQSYLVGLRILTVVFILEILVYFRNILFPLMKIEKLIAERKENLDDNEDETVITNLYDKLESILDNKNEQALREYSLEMNKKQAELMALQSQINPHFLYNTLDCIRGIALEQGVSSIDEMTKALSDMFRYSVSNNQIKVKFYQEIENIRNYLTIQQYRFNNSLEIMEDIDEDVYSLLVPKFIIQPIVENAVFHGLEPKLENRRLKLSANRTEKRFVIIIEDNGIGMAVEKVSSLNALLEAGTALVRESRRTGIGITNVNERIRLLYGEEYGIRIRSCSNVGTQVVITIPAENSDQ